MDSRAHVFVSGRVQGVFFRSGTLDEARYLKLTGWVKNLPDRRVEAVFEGPKDKVAKMVNWCSRGPPGANVTDVKADWEQPTGEFNTFAIVTW